MIKFENATKNYGKRCVFCGLDFEITTPEIIMVAGENGAGKSTFLNCVAGNLKISAGKIAEISGGDLSENCVLFNEKTYYPSKKIEKIIEEIASLDSRFDADVCRRILKEFRLSEKNDYGKLSRGQKMHFGEAATLAWNKPVLLFDEPCAGLDEFSRFKFYEILNGNFTQNPRTIFISTNLLGEFENIASKILLFFGDGEYLFENSDYYENLFIRVEGESAITDILAQSRKVYAKKEMGYMNSFVIANDLDYREKKLAKQSELKISAVSAASACGFLIEERRGK